MEGTMYPSREQIAARLWRLVTKGDPDYLFGAPGLPVAAENAASALVAAWTDDMRSGRSEPITSNRMDDDVQAIRESLSIFRDRARQAVTDPLEPWEALTCVICGKRADTLYTDRYVQNGCAVCRAKAKDGRDPGRTLVPAAPRHRPD